MYSIFVNFSVLGTTLVNKNLKKFWICQKRGPRWIEFSGWDSKVQIHPEYLSPISIPQNGQQPRQFLLREKESSQNVKGALILTIELSQNILIWILFLIIFKEKSVNEIVEIQLIRTLINGVPYLQENESGYWCKHFLQFDFSHSNLSTY